MSRSGDVATRQVRNEARASAYLLFSALLTSPGQRCLSIDGAAVAQSIAAVAAALPGHHWCHARVCDAFADLDADAVRRFDLAYGSLFEVPDSVCAIREEHAPGVPPGRKEEAVRYYDYFGYRPIDALSWQPDHLAVELEFLYFLIEGELQADADGPRDSFARAQYDFCTRHPGAWVPGHAARAESAGAQEALVALLAGLEEFLQADLAWRHDTLPMEVR